MGMDTSWTLGWTAGMGLLLLLIPLRPEMFFLCSVLLMFLLCMSLPDSVQIGLMCLAPASIFQIFWALDQGSGHIGCLWLLLCWW